MPTPDAAPAHRGVRARRHARAALSHAWTAFHPVPALYCAPGVVAAVAIGLWLGQPGGALLAAAGAFTAGFGAYHRLTRLRFTPMILATLCMSLSTIVGTVASGAALVEAALVGAACLSLGVAGRLGTAFWWVLLQGAVFLIISGGHPAGLGEAMNRGLVVLLGGAGQSLLIEALRRLAPRGFPSLAAPGLTPPPTGASAWIREVRLAIAPGAPELLYGAVLASAAAAAILLADRIALPNGYWAAMTVVLVLRPGGLETATRGSQRLAGTLVGAAAATALVVVVRPGLFELVLLTGIAAWGAYATQWVNYGTFSLSVTSFVAFLFAILGLPEAKVAVYRIDATCLGAAIAATALILLLSMQAFSERLLRKRALKGVLVP